FIAVNCAALPSTLIESELFGREKGAYTGAISRQIGRFESADKSSIFLDEVGELSLEAQAKLLRILQEGELERLGSTKTIKVDIRVIAATNRNLEKAIKDGTFRRDLFFRLNVFPIDVPPLRERRSDIPILAWHFVSEFCDKMGKKIENIPRVTMEMMQTYEWPGNVRELRNVVERGMIMSKGSTLKATIPKIASFDNSQIITLAEAQRKHILKILERTGWRVRGKSGAAEILGMKPSTLESRMNKLGIKRMVNGTGK
ncbi:MAG: sigma 54-interacting transcriptional regulator, partial [Bacteroidales bacterium]|nr:sigma 54-interacting transcriptional regulator [Candidatus Latescibacterota bacterium]